MNIGIAILGLAFLILIHEAGHFFVARAVGMRPRKFYIGFPPALAKVQRNGIEYGIGAIPLGGYVKIPGMHRPAKVDVEIHFGRARHDDPGLVGPIERLKRPLIAGEMESARAALDELRAAIATAELSQPARKAAERGLRELADGLGDDAYWRQKVWKKITVIFAGPAANLVFAVGLLAAVYMIGAPAFRTVESVQPASPAARAGLQPGDAIVAIGGERIPPGRVQEIVPRSEGGPLVVTVERDGERRDLAPVRPTKMDGDYRLGFLLKNEISHERFGVGDAIGAGASETWNATAAIGASLKRIVSGGERDDVASVVGIVQGSSRAADYSFRLYLEILAFISLSLALLNLLPLLPLDGGHILFSIIERIRGRAAGREAFERVSVVGIALVLLLFAIGLSNDIGRLGGG